MKNDIEIKKQREATVKKSNALARARYKMAEQEQSVLTYLISLIDPKDKVLKPQIFSIKKFCDVTGIVRSGNSYADVKDTIKSLAQRQWWIDYEDEGKLVLHRWLDNAEIHYVRGNVKLQLSQKLADHLINVRKHYTEYELLKVLGMRGQYSIQFYELMRSHRNEDKQKNVYYYSPKYTIDELRTQFWTTETEEKTGKVTVKYKQTRDFLKRVIFSAMREVNKYTDLEVTCEEHIGARNAVEALTFTIKGKDSEAAQDAEDETYARLDRRIIKGQQRIDELPEVEYVEVKGDDDDEQLDWSDAGCPEIAELQEFIDDDDRKSLYREHIESLCEVCDNKIKHEEAQYLNVLMEKALGIEAHSTPGETEKYLHEKYSYARAQNSRNPIQNWYAYLKTLIKADIKAVTD